MESCIKIPIYSLSKCFLNEFANSSGHSNQLIFSSQEPYQVPSSDYNLNNTFQQYTDDPRFIRGEIENALRTHERSQQGSQLSAHSAQASSSSLIRSLESSILEIRLPLSRELSPLEKFAQYKRMLRETIQRRKVEMGRWTSRVQGEIRENKLQCRQLFELLTRRKKAISEYCREKKQQLKASVDNYRVRNMAYDLLLVSFVQAEIEKILEDFLKRYSERMKRLNEKVKEIKNERRKQDKKVQENKVMLEKKYEERQRSPGNKNSLLFYELSLMRETKKQFDLEKDLRDFYVTLLREIKPTDEEEKVLKIGLIMREIYRRGEILTALMNWVELREEEGRLKVNEKDGFLLGNPNPMRIALTKDKFLLVYRMDLANGEFSFEKQSKIINMRRDEQNLNRMYVREVKSGLLWNKENEFCVELGAQRDVREFIEDFGRYY